RRDAAPDLSTPPLHDALPIFTVQPAGGGPEITRAIADQDGRFQIPIAPGTYLIVPLPPDPNAVLPRGTPQTVVVKPGGFTDVTVDRKSTRLNSSHEWISYAVC